MKQSPEGTEQEGMPKGMRIAESIFDICYLAFDLVAAIIFFTQAQ